MGRATTGTDRMQAAAADPSGLRASTARCHARAVHTGTLRMATNQARMSKARASSGTCRKTVTPVVAAQLQAKLRAERKV